MRKKRILFDIALLATAGCILLFVLLIGAKGIPVNKEIDVDYAVCNTGSLKLNIGSFLLRDQENSVSLWVSVYGDCDNQLSIGNAYGYVTDADGNRFNYQASINGGKEELLLPGREIAWVNYVLENFSPEQGDGKPKMPLQSIHGTVHAGLGLTRRDSYGMWEHVDWADYITFDVDVKEMYDARLR